MRRLRAKFSFQYPAFKCFTFEVISVIYFFIWMKLNRKKKRRICIDVNVKFRCWSTISNCVNRFCTIHSVNQQLRLATIFDNTFLLSTESPRTYKWTPWKLWAFFQSASCPQNPTLEKSGDKLMLYASM